MITSSDGFRTVTRILAVGLLAAALSACKNNADASADSQDDDAPRSTAAVPIKSSTTQPGQTWTPPKSTERQDERDAMVQHIREVYGFTYETTLAALLACPRHEFVAPDLIKDAYTDSPLPIAYGQLISQPFIVAHMTHELHVTSASKVLEIGTGSAYQAAILSYFTQNVYSIEIIRPLADAAGERLKRLGYDPIQTRCGDGFNGWPEAAPFDAIIVTCAAGRIPPPLIKQLAPGGRMLIPVGQPFTDQSLMLVEKDATGKTIPPRILETVRFVPLLQKDPTANGK